MTSKLQLTVPKAIADQYGIKPGDELEWIPAAGVRESRGQAATGCGPMCTPGGRGRLAAAASNARDSRRNSVDSLTT